MRACAAKVAVPVLLASGAPELQAARRALPAEEASATNARGAAAAGAPMVSRRPHPPRSSLWSDLFAAGVCGGGDCCFLGSSRVKRWIKDTHTQTHRETPFLTK